MIDIHHCDIERSYDRLKINPTKLHLAFDENSFPRHTLAEMLEMLRRFDGWKIKNAIKCHCARGPIEYCECFDESRVAAARKRGEGGGVDRHEIWIRLVRGHKRKRHGELIGRRGTRETCDLIKSLPSTADGVETEPPHPRRVISLVSTRRRP